MQTPLDAVTYYDTMTKSKGYQKAVRVETLISFLDKQNETFIKEYKELLDEREKQVNTERNLVKTPASEEQRKKWVEQAKKRREQKEEKIKKGELPKRKKGRPRKNETN